VGPKPPRPAAHAWDVVVSAGGGVVGARLLETAIRARPSSPLAQGSWLLLAGRNLPDSDFARLEDLAAQAGGGVTLLRSVPDLAGRLASARLSISQAGYNTVADILASGCAAVLCPFAAGGETEQTARADALAAAGRATVVPESALSPDLMVHAIAAAIALPTAAPVLLDGAERTAKLLGEFAGGGRPGRFDS
jgi:predicted glycosyltransferase